MPKPPTGVRPGGPEGAGAGIVTAAAKRTEVHGAGGEGGSQGRLNRIFGRRESHPDAAPKNPGESPVAAEARAKLADEAIVKNPPEPEKTHRGAPVLLRSKAEEIRLGVAQSAAVRMAAERSSQPLVPTEPMSPAEMQARIKSGEIPNPSNGYAPKQIEGDARYQDCLVEARSRLGEQASERALTGSALESYYLNRVKSQRSWTTNREVKKMLREKPFKKMFDDVRERIKAAKNGGEPIDGLLERQRVLARWQYMHDVLIDQGEEEPRKSWRDIALYVLLSIIWGAVTSTDAQARKATQQR